MSVDASTRVMLTIDPATDSNTQEIEELTHRLMTELEPIPGLEVGRVPSGCAPSGSMGEAFGLGQLVLTFARYGGVLLTAIGLTHQRLTREHVHVNSVELKCGDVSLTITKNGVRANSGSLKNGSNSLRMEMTKK